jgi:hypothetical protein
VQLSAFEAELAVPASVPASDVPQVVSAALPDDSAAPVWSAPACSVVSALVGCAPADLFPDGLDSLAAPVAPMADPADLAWSRLAWSVEYVPVDLFPDGLDSLAAPVAPMAGSADSAWSRLASLVEYVPVDWSPDDLEFPVHFPADSADSVSACPADWAVD